MGEARQTTGPPEVEVPVRLTDDPMTEIRRLRAFATRLHKKVQAQDAIILRLEQRLSTTETRSTRRTAENGRDHGNDERQRARC